MSRNDSANALRIGRASATKRPHQCWTIVRSTGGWCHPFVIAEALFVGGFDAHFTVTSLEPYAILNCGICYRARRSTRSKSTPPTLRSGALAGTPRRAPPADGANAQR